MQNNACIVRDKTFHHMNMNTNFCIRIQCYKTKERKYKNSTKKNFIKLLNFSESK